MHHWERPILLVSRCLGFEACRYNGAILQSDIVDQLKPYCEIVTVCPEKEIGLGVPRKPIRLVSEGGNILLIQHETNLDVTNKMIEFAQTWITNQPILDGAILKGRSPSCGIKAVKVYDKTTGNVLPLTQNGLFSQTILSVKPDLLLEEEGRLLHYGIREHFLTRLFGEANFREISRNPTKAALLDFHTRYKLILLHYHQQQHDRLGKIIAQSDQYSVQDLFQLYRTQLSAAWSKPPRCQSVINVLLHVFGFFKDKLSSQEKAYFLDLIQSYREARIPLRVVTQVLQTWILHYQIEYLDRQRFFNPYPEELISIENSGKAEVCYQ